jgi:HNH endonuclease
MSTASITTPRAITSTRSLLDLEAEIVATASALAVSRAKLLALVAEFDEAGGWIATGAVSCAHWLADLLDIELRQQINVFASSRVNRAVQPELILHRRVGTTELADGTPLHPSVARMLTCDCDLRVMTHYPDGSPADVGRRHRFVTPRLRRLVFERDRHCNFERCHSTDFLDVHHIVHWEDHGPTNLANLRLLCSHHHRFIHDKGNFPAA